MSDRKWECVVVRFGLLAARARGNSYEKCGRMCGGISGARIKKALARHEAGTCVCQFSRDAK